MGRAQMQIVILLPRLNSLGTSPQEWPSLETVSMRMSRIDNGFRLQQYGHANL